MERKITIEESQIYREDYQMKMLYMNDIAGILPVKGRGIDGTSFYDYNVSGKVSMQAMYERSKFSGKDLRLFLNQFLLVMKEIEKYLLNIHCILLEPEYIFCEEEKFYFCYYPLAHQDIWEKFHQLTEYFVKKTDYEDRESVRLTFALHKETMEENYSLEKIIKTCTEEKEEVNHEEKKMEYDTSFHDWMKEQHHGELIMEESDHMWFPVKKFLGRHKKPKWGDWDGLYIEEEEL